MAAPKKARLEAPVSCSSSGVGDGADVSKDVLAKLRAELEAEKKLVKQLKRDKSYDVQQVRDLEQNKATIAFKDLRTKLQQEKSKELEIQKEALTRKFDLDLQKGTKLKELELAKVQGDLKRCQEELQQVTKRGLSGAARGAFEAERSKLLQEAKELRAEKRHLEETLRSVTDADKQKAHELRRLQDSRKSDIAKTKKEADIEIRKLLDEVRSKERIIGNLEKDAVSRQDGASHVTKLQMENESMEQLLSLAKEASSWERRSSKTHNNGLTPPAANGSDYIPTEKGSPPPGQDESPQSQPVTTEDFQSQIEALRVQCSAYQQDKTDLLQKIKDMDKKNRLQIEKNKKFLEKNMELTNINRSLEDKIKKLNEETGKLKHQLDRSKRENLKLSEQLTSDSTVKETSIAVKEELEDLRRQTEEQEKAVAALKLACSEKDRRIELLAHRQRKTKLSRSQQKMVRFLLPAKLPNVAAGIKETYFGFEEDTLSIDSEMSNSSRMSSSCLSPDISMEDEVFDEFTREEFEKNYQRLSREHMELEKSYALLQSQVGQSHVDPGREIKDLGWLLEKETLNKTVRMLKEKVHNQEKHEGRILHQTREIQEQNEVLEFRVLELEEANEKLMKEVSNTVTFMGAPILTENGVLQMMAVEMGMVQVGVSELKEKILDIKFKQVAQEDQLALLQTHALLDASDKKLKDTQTTLESLRGRIKTLEEEKADLLSAATGVSPDLVLEHEDTRNQLAEANVRIQQLEAELEELRKREAIYKYTEQVNLKTESRYKKEISTLSRQLSNSSEGRDYERELWEDNIERLKTAERELTEQQAAHKALLDQVKALEQDRSGLERHLEHIQDHQDLAESDKDTNTLLHSIQCKLDQKEKSEVELMEKAQNLEAEVSSLRSRMTEYEANEAHLTDRNVSVQEELEKVRERCCHLEAELVNTKEARDKDVEKLRNTVHSLEKESEAAAQRVEELQGSSAGLEAANTQLSQEVASLQAAKAELERLQQIRDDATEMDSTRGTLQIKLGELQDVEFEARVQQLLKAEVTLKLKVLSLQKKDAIMRSQLQESEQRLRTRVAEHQADMDDLERELDQLRKSEAKLRNKLQYGSTEQESQALAKIQRLEELVFDLESAERKLKRQVHDLQESEAELKARLTQSEASSSLSLHSALHDIDIKDRERDLEKQLQMLESSEKTLKEKLEKLDVSDSTAALLSRVAELERSERSLRLKLELMESQAQHCLEEDTPSMLDSPEAVLRQRIRDFEKHERHLKQQVGELEKDREELHDITRRDKSLIHELNLQIRELQLSENNLKEQVNTLEAEENKLHLQVSDMADRVEDLQNLTKRMQTAEQTLNVKVRQQEENEVQLSNKLENTRDNMNAMEQKFKKKNNDLEKERRDFAVKVDELTDRVGDLEGVEMTLKQKVRNLENSETSLKEQLEGLERSEEKLKRRTSELESLNESLAQKVHKLEEEKANLLYEMSDLEMFKEEHMSESDQLKKNIRALKDQLDDTQGRMETLQGRLDEMARKEVELQATLGQKERSEKDLRDHVTGLERVIDEMRRQLEAMSSDVTATASKLQNASHLERENNFLQGQMERHLVNNNELTEDREELLKKVKFYENSADVPSVITLPQQEVADLRRHAALLDETQSKLTKAEKSEKNLRDTVAKLRQGKDACGHEAELADLKKLSDQHNAAVQAHEVLKMNYGDLKNQLKNLQYRVKSGEVELLQRSAVSSKATQVRLAESYTLRQLAPEFRNAMKNLGARHPQAYHEFTHDLQPQSSRRISRVHTHDGPDVAMPTVQNGVIAEETVEAQHQDRSESSHQAAPPCADTQGDQKTQPKRPLEAASEDERRALIGQLVEALPGASPEPASEDPLWRAVEGKSPEGAAGEKELPYWKEVEGKNTDDMALTVELWGWRDDSGSDASGPVTPHRGDAVLKGPPPGARTPTSTEAPPPPLPTSLPPTSRPPRQRSESPTNDDSYYPPSHHGYDSADEASEIVDEDDGAGVRLHVKPPRGTSTSPSPSSIQLRAKSLERLLPDRSLDADSRRAKSVERDSDFSEGSFLGPSPSPKTWGRTRGGRRMPGSLESIPDSGMESFRQDDVINSMKDRIHNLETQLKNKEEELNSKVTAAEEDSKRKIHHIQKEIDVLRQQLDRKNKELNAQNNEVVRLTDEVRRLNDQRQTVTKDTSLPERHRQLQQRLEDLQKHYQALLDQNPVSGKPSEDKIALEKIVLKLRGQLKDFDRIELERQDLQKKLSVLEEEYKLKVKSESELTKENAKLRHQLDSFSKENKQLQAMEDDYIKVRVKFDEMEQMKSKALTMITPLRAKVMRLAQKCKSKDELIARLASVLRRTGEPSDVLAEADRVTAQAASEEYSRPISPLTLQTLQAFETELSSSEATTWFASKYTKPSKIPRRARRSSGDSSGTHSDSSASDIEALLDANVSLNGFPKSDSHTAAMATRDNQSLRRSHSTDDLGGDLDVTPCRHGVSADDDVAVSSPHVSLLPVTLLNTQSDLCSSGQEPTRGAGQAAAAASSRRDKRTRSAPTKDTYNGAAGAGVAKGLFRAVKDYEPKDFSYSGHQKLELPLKEGDLVKVLGPVDGHGYQEAEVNGKLGLVPALYLLPASPPETRVTSKHRTTQLPSSQANGSPEQILAMYEHLKQVHVPKFTVPSSPSIASPPATAPSRRSLPATLTHPAYQRNAVLPPVSPRSLGVGHPAFSLQGNQAPGATSSGPPEPPSNFRIQRIVGESSVLLSWAPPPMDELARSNGTAVRGYKILIDNRDKQTVSSPHLTKALIEKLNLRRAHSFSIQTLAEGGLTSRMADTLFDDVMPEQGPDGAGQAERDWTAPDVDVTSVLSSTVTDDGERRVFLAVYDYKPTEHSPQNFPGQEVAFKTGDVIVTYGGVREDGFYYGKVHGKKGLVPASFMEEVALLRPRGRRSASSSSCASYQYSSSTLGSASRLSSAPSSRPLSSQSTHSYQSRKSSGSSKVATATV